MNWYKHLLAMPVPQALNYPETYRGGLKAVDRRLDQEDATTIEKEHGPLSFLGHGSYGVAYDEQLGKSNTVVKITQDESEYKAALKLMQNPIPCAVRVYSAKELRWGNWKIITERLNKLSPKHIEIVDDIWMGWTRGKEALFDEIPKRRNITVEEFAEIFEKYEKMSMCLESHGYQSIGGDAHGDNIGSNSAGDYVLLDLGQSLMPSR